MVWKATLTVADVGIQRSDGQLVSSELCTVVDDGTMRDRRGSVAIDDEGTPGQYNVLIEGVLKGYAGQTQRARLMGVAPTGNGRRESYAHLPMPRMTNLHAAGQIHAAGDYRIR
jgi:TldD protein